VSIVHSLYSAKGESQNIVNDVHGGGDSIGTYPIPFGIPPLHCTRQLAVPQPIPYKHKCSRHNPSSTGGQIEEQFLEEFLHLEPEDTIQIKDSGKAEATEQLETMEKLGIVEDREVA
jgi:hypothetical protein